MNGVNGVSQGQRHSQGSQLNGALDQSLKENIWGFAKANKSEADIKTIYGTRPNYNTIKKYFEDCELALSMGEDMPDGGPAKETPPSASPVSKSDLESKLGGMADIVKRDFQDGFSEDKFKEYYGDEPNYEDLVAYFRILVAEKTQDRHSRTSFNIQPPVESRHQKGQINNR